jgi:hypothetical protein
VLKLYVDGQGERRSTIAGVFSGRRRPRAAKLPFSSLSSLPRPPLRDIPRKQHPLENYARLAYDIAVALEEHADIV